ncbi:histidine kinase [Chitinophaga skermanii]|uniref:Histidine kinase n=1 Tax=Chitinophaga skermanii TaxID=331697 RepID=A0A327QCH4_9BACT|nr:histidine kinase [Chitinophaga skermanii]RAJ01568.1 histidine kinase [Chitinophaga skermanii]
MLKLVDTFLHGSWPFWTIILLTGVLIVLLVFTREKSIRKKLQARAEYKQQLAAMEWQAFQSQMDPHFIFNSLNAIQHFILSTSTEQASLHLTRFSKLMRLTIDHCSKEWISLASDLEALELYIQLEQLRFEGQFEFDITVQAGLDAATVQVPPFIIQPYVQDAIWKHLLTSTNNQQGGKLWIEAGVRNGELVIRLEDNGISAWPPSKNNYRYRPPAEDVTYERLHFINEKYHANAHISSGQLFNLEGGRKGTYTLISLPAYSTGLAMDKLRIIK